MLKNDLVALLIVALSTRFVSYNGIYSHYSFLISLCSLPRKYLTLISIGSSLRAFSSLSVSIPPGDRSGHFIASISTQSPPANAPSDLPLSLSHYTFPSILIHHWNPFDQLHHFTKRCRTHHIPLLLHRTQLFHSLSPLQSLHLSF